MPPEEFGAWGQWAGALTSGVAVVVALWVAISDGRRRAREIADQKAAQARTITARVDKMKAETRVGDRVWTNYVDAVVVENHGTLPITNVKVLSVTVWSGYEKWLEHWVLLREEGDLRGQLPFTLGRVIGPGELKWNRLSFEELEEGEKFDLNQASVEISFVDAQGIKWGRTANAEPFRIYHMTQDRWEVMRSTFRFWERWLLPRSVHRVRDRLKESG